MNFEPEKDKWEIYVHRPTVIETLFHLKGNQYEIKYPSGCTVFMEADRFNELYIHKEDYKDEYCYGVE